MVADGAEWLAQADNDLEDAAFTLEGGRERVTLFLCHQAAEKALKAWHIADTGDHPYTHDLVRLAPEEVDEEIMEVLGVLNTVYTGVRYPGQADPDVSDPEHIYDAVDELVAWIRTQLNV